MVNIVMEDNKDNMFVFVEKEFLSVACIRAF